MKNTIIKFISSIILISSCYAQNNEFTIIHPEDIKTGAERTEMYFPLLNNKNIAIVANHTSLIGDTHLADTLLSSGFNLIKVFSPEHGFREIADAGKTIENNIDIKTGLPVISLYGSKKKPSNEDLKNIDIVLFDIQDVGVRVYTYISTMTYVMEACAENNISLIIPDRPNPNGHYVDGPVLDTSYRSFVGLHPIPLVHGMTIGEYAKMINGEGWLKNELHCDLTIIPVANYDHNKLYQLPVKPSPNLPTINSVYLYPSLVLFEGTIISVGRGTDYPFEVIGHPEFMTGSYVFTPESKAGAIHPKYENKHCYGISLINHTKNTGPPNSLDLHYLLNMHDYFKDNNNFFNHYFDKLAGSDKLRYQIINGKSIKEITNSWQEDLNSFKEVRIKYLLYPDFTNPK